VGVGRTAEGIGVLSERKVLVMFVTFDGKKNPARNISQRHKVV
jgi:hypothetical protein